MFLCLFLVLMLGCLVWILVKCCRLGGYLVEIVHSSVKNKVERDVEKAIAFTERMRRLFVGRRIVCNGHVRRKRNP